MEDILIIGAGTAGLGLAYELKRRGVFPAIIDGADRVADRWRRRHPQLRLNTSARTSHQPGMKMPADFDVFPHRDAYIRYLEDYYAFLDIPVEFAVSAQRIEQGDRGWRVVTDRGDRTARHVVVCTGAENVPFYPHWPGAAEFPGQIIHAADLGEADAYAGRTILIVGAGNSGVDVGNTLAEVALARAWISVRSGSTIVPRWVLGRPAQEWMVALRHTPLKLRDGFTRLVSRLFFGDLSRYGIPPSKFGPISRQYVDGVAVAIDDGFVAALKDGKFEAVAGVESVNRSGVHLACGRVIDPDIIICATGYRCGLEPLVGHLEALNEKGRPRFSPGTERGKLANLWFFGLDAAPHGNMYVRRAEAGPLARRIVRTLK